MELTDTLEALKVDGARRPAGFPKGSATERL
jgi:hypothetical protein